MKRKKKKDEKTQKYEAIHKIRSKLPLPAIWRYLRQWLTIETLIHSLPYVITAYLGNRMSWLYRHARGDPIGKVMTMVSHPGLAFQTVFPSFNFRDIVAGIITGITLFAVIIYRRNHRKKFRDGEEYGSARWGTHKDIAPFIDPVFRNNIPLTATERLMCSFPSGISGNFEKPSNPKYGRNKNVMVVGGSGERVIIVIPHGSAANTQASAA